MAKRLSDEECAKVSGAGEGMLKPGACPYEIPCANCEFWQYRQPFCTGPQPPGPAIHIKTCIKGYAK